MLQYCMFVLISAQINLFYTVTPDWEIYPNFSILRRLDVVFVIVVIIPRNLQIPLLQECIHTVQYCVHTSCFTRFTSFTWSLHVHIGVFRLSNKNDDIRTSLGTVFKFTLVFSLFLPFRFLIRLIIGFLPSFAFVSLLPLPRYAFECLAKLPWKYV